MKSSGGTAGPRIYPAIDLRGGRCVRLVRGMKEAEIRYDEDPLEAARRWVAEGASWLHVVDLGAAFGERDSTDEVLRIARSVAVPVQMGGGVRTEEGLCRLLEGGVARVMLGTKALKDPDFLARAIATHGGERILVSLDCAAGRLRISGWEEESVLGLEEAVARLESVGVTRFLVTATDRDGTFEGPRVDLVRRVLDAGRSRVIAAGGMGSLEHVRSVLEARHPRLDGVVIGRALYEGRIRLGEAISLEAEFGKAMSDATKKAEDDRIGGFKYDSSGLIPAVVQDSVDGQVLMVAYMNREALRRTLESGVTCFWSRSRQEYWVKGATSGNTQKVVRVLVDCDKDCLIVVVEQKGVACHTGKRSCFYREVHADGLPEIDTTAPVWKP